jgi:hypothetical protein|nr:hypothetical protein [Aeromicrobium sp.]
MLFDLHPAYRTLATSPDGQYGEYVADDATHDWDLDLAAGQGADRLSGVAVGLIGSAAVAAAAGGGWWWLRGGRRAMLSPSADLSA